jgi:formylglycine-generating enzyme required for sulfatase activity
MKERIKFLVTTTKGLVLINIGIISIVVALFGTLSGPLKEWGFGAIIEKLLGMDLHPTEREGRIIVLYHSIAITFTALIVYLITHSVKFKKREVTNIRTAVTVGYLLVVIFGLAFGYWGHNWVFHGLFITGLAIVFFSGVMLAVGLWPWRKEYYVTSDVYAHTKKGVSLERVAFFVMAVAMLGSAIFGAVAGSFFGNGFEVFLAENGVRHVHHSPLELAIIGHLHIMLTLIGIATALLIGRWFDWQGILHKFGMPLFIIGTIIITIGVWSVVPYQLHAHTIIYVGTIFSMTAALLLVIFGWGKLIKDGTANIEKPLLSQKLKALFNDPLRFGALWQMVFMNFTVSGVGIFMAIRLEEIFRTIPFREERITLTGHWHILSVLTGTIVLFYIMSEILPVKGKLRKWLGWTTIIGSDLAFAMITLFSLKRIWVTEEAQEPLVRWYMVLSEFGMGALEIILAVYMIWLLVKLINKKLLKSASIIILFLMLTNCGTPAPDVDPKSIDLKLIVDSNSWVTVPAGPFIVGYNGNNATIDYDYEVMVTEVTYVQYVDYLNKALANSAIHVSDGKITGYYKGDAFHNMRHEFLIEEGDNYLYYDLDGIKTRIQFNDDGFSVVDGYESFPVTYVTWYGANAYANYYGYRLPTVFEWEKAARGQDGRAYPFIHEPTSERANYHHSHDPFDKANGTTPVGFYNGEKQGDFQTFNSPSPYGCYDMAGNVAEWLGNILHGSHLRLFYGGSMMSYAFDLRSFTENSGIPEYVSFAVGFRCVRDL